MGAYSIINVQTKLFTTMFSIIQRLFYDVRKFCIAHPRRTFSLVIVVCLCIWLSDFRLYPSLSLTRVREGQTLDYFLHKTFNGSHDFAYASLYHIRKTAPTSFNPDYLQANYGLIARNGYLISIKKGFLTIVAPDESFVIRNQLVLPSRLLRLFWLQSVFVHVIIIGCFIVVGLIIVRGSLSQMMRMVKRMVVFLVLSPLLLPFFVIVFFFSMIMLSLFSSFFV